MNLAELFLGQIPEAIYFALFLIFTKRLKEKRVLFIILMILEYLLLKSFIHFDIWFQIGYTIMTFLTLKVLYKNKAQVTDIFTFGIASIVLMAISIISAIVLQFNFIIGVILSRLLPFIFLVLTHKSLYRIQKVYKKLWNRNKNDCKHIKSTTFRAINAVVFNVMFYILNFCMICSAFIGR